MTPKRLGASKTAKTLLVVSILGSVALAGGIERNSINGLVDVTETWSPLPAGGVPFNVWRHQDANGQFFAAGYGYIQGLPPGLSQNSTPGLYSAVLAANKWGLYDPVVYPHYAAASFNYQTPTVGGVSSAASSFSPLSAPPPMGIGSPTGVTLVIPPRVFYANGSNTLNLYEPPASFGPIGGSLPLAVALVYLNQTTGKIFESDIAVNSLSAVASGAPIYSFVETNADLGRSFATNPTYSVAHVQPTVGYASLLGVLTHEFGHCAGLGHSLVDCDKSPAGNELATMNFYGEVDGSLNLLIGEPGPAPTFGYTDTNITTTGTFVRGYFGREAETLSQDDRSALVDGYPAPPGTITTVGSIRGTVFQDPSVSGQPNIGMRGGHVIAFDPDDPNVRRASAISITNGTYVIDGLRPGTYVVMLEPIDLGGYVPAIPGVLPAIASPFPFTSYFTEMYGGPTGESHAESTLHQVFTAVTVTSGGTTANIDFRVEALPAGTPDPLRVRTSSQLGPLGASPPATPFLLGPSSHGLEVPVFNAGAFPTTAFFDVDAGPANAGRLIYLFGAITSGRTDVGPLPGTSYIQLYQLDAGAPTVTPVYLNSLGRATVPFVLPNGLGLISIYVQGFYDDVNAGHFVMTNKVQVRTYYP